MTEGLGSGIASPLLLGKLMRLAGADASSFNSPYSVYPLLREKYAQTARNLTMPLYDVRAALPVPGGGIHPATAARIIADLGADVLLSVGGAIQGHPQGATAGARAMRQAIDAAASGVGLAEFAVDHEELRVAIGRWGASAQ
jgi:2,3-diketo-5-methylthiopentyl-1-phosphate enolase